MGATQVIADRYTETARNTARVREILSWYESDNPGTKTNIARLLNHGRLAGTGKLVILPVDQGFEHGPARSFAVNPPAYNPDYHFEVAIEAGCNAYAAPLGFLEAAAARHAGEIPLILKLNNHDTLHPDKDPISAVTGSVKEALRLGCVAIGFTIYPGSANSREMYQQLRGLTEEAKQAGLAVVVWSYPRGSAMSKEGELSIDVVAYAAHIAAELGAHIVKVKLPTAHIEQPEAQKAYTAAGVPIATLPERVRHVVESTFDGRRIVIFSGGAKKDNDEDIYDEARAIRDGGGFGSIIGRNSFQRPKAHAITFLETIMDIYAGKKK
ncbi:MAG: class I fructose-bisphosphate aldolase [Acidobacteriota bacterium]|nr:class I fructose-bisphosphate aldolase [Acidobacteriota bacterium]